MVDNVPSGKGMYFKDDALAQVGTYD
jgi:hypothetical protein